MNVLAIDPGITMGWATFGFDEYHSGTKDFSKARKKSAGDMYAEMYKNLMNTCSTRDISVIVIEEPTPVNMRSARIQYGTFAIPQMFAAKCDIGYTVAYPNEVRAFVNNALMDAVLTDDEVSQFCLMTEKVKEKKLPSIRYFYHRQGHLPKDDNEADAFALLRYYMAKME